MWLSIPFGLVITLICFSGAMLVFEDEVYELIYSERYFVKSVESTAIPMDELLKKVARILPDSVAITGVSISSAPERTYQVSLSKPRRASIYVDPYTGEITGKSERSSFFLYMFRLHRWLLDSMNSNGEMSLGKLVVGISTLLFVVVLVSGLVVWWPRTRKALKNSFRISANRGWRRFWFDLHVSGGVYAFVFLLVMALTGLTWSFTWYRTAFYKVFGVEVQQLAHGKEQKKSSQGNTSHKDGLQRSESQRNESKKTLPAGFVYWQEVYDNLKRQNPEYKQISVSSGMASVAFKHFGNQRAADRYSFNIENGEFTETNLYQHQDKSGKIRGWIYSVHVGSWGGMVTRMLAFLAALIGAVLPLTGYYLWIKKIVNKRKRKTPAVLSSPQ